MLVFNSNPPYPDIRLSQEIYTEDINGKKFDYLLPSVEFDFPLSRQDTIKSILEKLRLIDSSDEKQKTSRNPKYAVFEDFAENPPFHYIWPALEVKLEEELKRDQKTLYRGAGVFTKQPLAKNTLIPYYAYSYEPAIFPKDYQNCLLLSGNFAYTLHSQNIGKQQEFVSLGDPNFSPWINPNGIMIGLRGLAIGALINEPSQGEEPNCQFIELNPHLTIGWLQTLREIKKGEQLLVCYGGYTRQREYQKAVNQQCIKEPKLVLPTPATTHQSEFDAFRAHFRDAMESGEGFEVRARQDISF